MSAFVQLASLLLEGHQRLGCVLKTFSRDIFYLYYTQLIITAFRSQIKEKQPRSENGKSVID